MWALQLIVSDRPPVDYMSEEGDYRAEEGELSEEQELNVTEPNQALSEEHAYRETMSGIRSFMG